MYGFQPKSARGKTVQQLADGGMVHSIKGMLGLRPKTREELLAADAKAQARNQEAAGRVAERAAQQPQPAPATPAPPAAISDYSGMNAMQRREKEQGLKNGGMVKPHGFKAGGMILGPGTGTSDSIETEKRPGTFIMPADSTQAIGPDALEELGEPEEMGEEAEGMEEQAQAVPVRLSNGEFEFSPEQVQALGEAVLTVMRDATHERAEGQQKVMPKAAGFAPRQLFADGGTVQDPEEERKRRIAQIPVGGTMPAPPADGSGSSEFTRNVNNGLNALGGMGVVASVPLRAGQAAKAAATGSGATALPSGIPRLAGPAQAAAAPAADFVAGMGPGATTYANTIPRLGNAPTPVLPGTNAALQQGAQANAMSGAVRAASGASAGATGQANTQPNDPTAAAPAAAPAPAAPSEYSRQMSAVGGALADGAAWLGKTIVSAPGYGLNRPSAAPAVQSAAGGGRGSINPAPVTPSLPAPTMAATTTADAPPPEASAAAAGPAPLSSGVVTPQNDAAAQALSAAPTAPAGFQPSTVTAPTVLHSGNSWQARNDLRNLEVSASSITNNGGRFDRTRGNNAAQAAYRSALQADAAARGAQPGLDAVAMRENAGITREGMQQAGATTRTGMQEQGSNTREAGRTALAQGELGLKREAAGFQTRAAAQQEALRNVLLDPNATPEQRKIAQRSLAALSGKTAADRMQVVNLPDTVSDQGMVMKGGQALIRTLEDGTVEQVPIGGQDRSSQRAAPKVGAVEGGYKFKGGDPANPASWQKV